MVDRKALLKKVMLEVSVSGQLSVDVESDYPPYRPSTIDNRLLAWFDQNKRPLPWRETRDPYAIWVSEIMLQQTQVATVIPYYQRWMERFPTVQALAEADEQEVLSLWQGLGYYRRCKMLLEGAKQVASIGLPSDCKDWQKIKGVGRYTAGAIASIALNEPVPLVDGNVERVFARLTACSDARPKLTNKAWAWADEVLSHKRPGDWNQALMELGATVCTPSNPSCASCPLHPHCLAFKQGLVDKLPIAKKKPAAVKLKHTIWIPTYNGLYGVRQIPSGQWWAGMWEFPRTASDSIVDLQMIIGSAEVSLTGVVTHSVTNHQVKLNVSLARCEHATTALLWLSADQLKVLPMPAPQRKALGLVLPLL